MPSPATRPPTGSPPTDEIDQSPPRDDLDAVYRRIDDAVIAFDREWRLTYGNERAAAIFDVAAAECTDAPSFEDCLGEVIWDVYPALEETQFESAVREAMTGQERTEAGFRGPITGTWYRLRAFPSETGVSVYFHDVTDRRERKQELRRYERMVETVGDGVYALDEDRRFLAVNEAFCDIVDRDREELVGAHVSEYIDEEVVAAGERAQNRLDAGEDDVTLTTSLSRPDGTEIPAETRISRLDIGKDGGGRVGVVRDVTERKEHERKLRALSEAITELMGAETREAVCEVAAETARETLDLPNALVALYDKETGLLEPVGGDPDAYDDALIGSGGDDVAWQAFVEEEPHVYDDIDAESDRGSFDLGSVMVLPLGKQGVFLSAAEPSDALCGADASLANILAAAIQVALDRTAREDELRERTSELKEKNRALERVRRVNGVIRRISQVLTRTTSREEIEQAVCERLVGTDPYRFAWIGTVDAVSDEIEPVASAGDGAGYLDAITVTADDSPTGQGPCGRAVRLRETQAQNNIHDDPPFEPWREAALKRGYRSVVSVPIVHGETLYGVFNVYADHPNVFNGMERTVLTELGEIIGHAFNALEHRQALLSDRSVELTFEVSGARDELVSPLADLGAESRLENVVQRHDGRIHVFFTIEGADAETVTATARRTPAVERISLVADRDSELLFECALDRLPLLDRGARLEEAVLFGGEGRITVVTSPDAAVRTYAELLESSFEEVELSARREHEIPVRTTQEFRAEFRERLTTRQKEVLRTAYSAGFFEWPRESSGQEVAEILDVSQPTVHRHIRTSERKLFTLLFDEQRL